MARRLKPYFLPELWMTMGGRRLPHTGDGSRLGDESREDGLEESERGDRGLMRGPPLPSSAGCVGWGGWVISARVRPSTSLPQAQVLPAHPSPRRRSPAVMMSDRADTEADLGTRPLLPPLVALALSASLGPPRRRPRPASGGLGVECRVPVLLLRRRARLRAAASARGR